MITPRQDNKINLNYEETYRGGKSFLFDFSKGDFNVVDGKLQKIDELDALKVWIEKSLRTVRNKYKIYENKDYGIMDLKELITSDFPVPFVNSEIEREVTETLLKNKQIKSIENFKFNRDKSVLVVSFDCHTIYGAIESEVNIS